MAKVKIEEWREGKDMMRVIVLVDGKQFIDSQLNEPEALANLVFAVKTLSKALAAEVKHERHTVEVL